MITDNDIEYIDKRLKNIIELIKSMGYRNITLNDYYTSTMKIIEEAKENNRELE